MKNIYKISFLFIICISALFIGGMVFAYQNPIVNAGPDIYVTSGSFASNNSAVLQGSASDPNNGNLNFFWSCSGGSLSNYNMLQPLFTAPNSIWQGTTYTCTLTAVNNYGLSSSDSTTVYVNYNSINNYNYNVNVQTLNASNNFNGQATLNGLVSGTNYPYGTVYVWFQWGQTTSYGFESQHNPIGTIGQFNQHIAELLPNTTYHYRTVAQQSNGALIYGQDTVFNSSGYAAYVPPVVYGGQVLGAATGPTYVSTGLTNNFLLDSFFLPLLLIIAGLWFYFSGEAYVWADKIKKTIKK